MGAVQYLKEAAEVKDDVNIEVLTIGVRFQFRLAEVDEQGAKTVFGFVSWESLEKSRSNPLLASFDRIRRGEFIQIVGS